MALNERQKLFVDEYLIDLNATAAAKRAGYSEKTAYRTGADLLKKPQIQEMVKKRLDEKHDKLIMKQDEVLQRLSAAGRREEVDYQVAQQEEPIYNERGDLIGMAKKPVTVQVPTQNKDSIKALELLGKYHTLFTEKQQIDVSGAIQFVDDID